MTKFSNKETSLNIVTNKDTFTMTCDNCSSLNYVAGSPYALGSFIYQVMIKTLLSMEENNCKIIKIKASWE